MKLKLRNKNYCDGCDQLVELKTIGGHKRCNIYRTVLLPNEDTFIASKGMGHVLRSEVCKKENEPIVSKDSINFDGKSDVVEIPINIRRWFKHIEDGSWHNYIIDNNQLFIDGKLIGEAKK